ncbi:uncharacterized protein BP5553_08895 [Venustampulla echinocandica]|uniref:Uncharacterized protein n=1 Tax=Venustampulla echinocandica TaxID=2656787 RepID=A0A370TD91_9HELO|nr:uncharacterized protein BP5553_08895 [Venustampulla echinocandica]RDL32439.1 hypothetical protein BP5553_08895 [Venustampulla echinocandica]
MMASFSTVLVAAQGMQDAPKTSGNPAGVVYEADLPPEPFFTNGALNGNIKGSIRAEAPDDGKGVRFTVRFENFPTEGGPFRQTLLALLTDSPSIQSADTSGSRCRDHAAAM